jgi:hypothetical protein
VTARATRPWLWGERGFPPPPGSFRSTLTLSGIPRLVIVLRILEASLTSTRCLSRDRLLIRWPMMVLYRKTAFSTKLRLL